MENITILPYGEYREEEILPIYEAVGWTNYIKKPDMLRAAYAGSLRVVGAYYGEKLVGVARAVGDGASILYIQDILVLPQYQRRGIGKKLLTALLSLYGDVYQTVLITDDQPSTVAFYGSMGLTDMRAMGCTAFMRIKTQ